MGCCGSNNHALLTSPHQVLELPPTRGGVLVGGNTGVFFLDEFRVVVSTPNYMDVPEFTLFNTLIPCGSRLFRVSPRYHGWWLCAHVDGDRCLGTLDQHKPHITDPAQAVLVVDLVSNGERVLIIVQIQTLMEHLFSTSAGACVPWDEWRTGAVVMKVLHRGSGSACSSPLVQGVRVTLVKAHITPAIDGNHFDFYLCTFDFSRRGLGALPLLDEGDGAERRALFEDGRDIWIQGHDEMTRWKFNSLCDSNFMYLVSSFRRQDSVRLMVWKGRIIHLGQRVTCLGVGLRYSSLYQLVRSVVLLYHQCTGKGHLPWHE